MYKRVESAKSGLRRFQQIVTMLCPDTSSNSLLHELTRKFGVASRAGRRASVYLLVAAITYRPLLAAAKFGPLPLWHLNGSDGRLPFFRDWGLSYALLVSLPSLVLLLVTDEYVLCSSLNEVQQDGE